MAARTTRINTSEQPGHLATKPRLGTIDDEFGNSGNQAATAALSPSRGDVRRKDLGERAS